MKSKYSNVLTIILIVAIVLIIGIAIVIGIKAYKNYINDRDAARTIAELEERNVIDDENQNIDDDILIEPVEEQSTEGGTGNNTNKTKVKYYKNFPMIGSINIPKTGAKYPVLLDVSAEALETSVGVMYPTNARLNKKGNVVIIGHNYRNGKLFSNNKKLEIGDKIQITDLEGKTLTYTIYEKFETTPNDTEYITRERGDNIEISLSTCTDDGNNRLVILAKVQ